MNQTDFYQKLKHLQKRRAKIYGEDRYHRSAVLIPLVEKAGQIEILFEVRSARMNRQPNDICFPGGKIDLTDPSPEASALRETEEEIGIVESKIKNVFPLDQMVSDIGSIIYPFVGEIPNQTAYDINPDEVQEVFTVPLKFFLDHAPKEYNVYLNVEPEADFPYELIHKGKNYDWRQRKMVEQFYLYEDRVIWGLTAKILSQFLDLIRLEEDRFVES